MFSRSAPRLLATAAVLALAVGGCAKRGGAGIDAQASFPDAYTERHPIVIGDVSKSIDVFLAANAGLDHRQKEDVKDFVKNFKESGKGALVATLPPAAPRAAVQHTLNEIRKVAGAGGVSAGMIRVASGPTHPTAASVRLSYAALEAKVTSKCGQWPHDPAGSTTLQSWENKPYYNLGCANQSMMAAQVANPIDHVRGRPEAPYDIQRRLLDIEAVRENGDPSTQWPTEATKINKSL